MKNKEIISSILRPVRRNNYTLCIGNMFKVRRNSFKTSDYKVKRSNDIQVLTKEQTEHLILLTILIAKYDFEITSEIF